MNVDVLPLGYARHLMVRTAPNGDEAIIGRFMKASLGEDEARLLRQVAPENRYHMTEETPVLPAFEGKL